MKRLSLILVLALPACQDPQLNFGASIGTGGVSVSPSISGNAGGVGVAISP